MHISSPHVSSYWSWIIPWTTKYVLYRGMSPEWSLCLWFVTWWKLFSYSSSQTMSLTAPLSPHITDNVTARQVFLTTLGYESDLLSVAQVLALISLLKLLQNFFPFEAPRALFSKGVCSSTRGLLRRIFSKQYSSIYPNLFMFFSWLFTLQKHVEYFEFSVIVSLYLNGTYSRISLLKMNFVPDSSVESVFFFNRACVFS